LSLLCQLYICMMELIYRLENIDTAAEAVLSVAGDKKILAFSGNLGAGKTTLINAICRRLGVKGMVSSPTFSIINEYDTDWGSIYHIDLYRCQNEEEAIRAGVEECLYSGRLCLVEWPARAEGIFPDSTLRLLLSETADLTRKIVIQ
jgi:tRNA threonylcarbamoyladenosine biosynthesis protein TsaE